MVFATCSKLALLPGSASLFGSICCALTWKPAARDHRPQHDAAPPARPLRCRVGHQVPAHMGLPDAWLEKNVMTWPAGSRTVNTS